VIRLRQGLCLALLGLLAPNVQGRDNTWTEPVTGMVFVALPKDCFRMGTSGALAPGGSLGWSRMGFTGSLSADEAPRHEVCLDAFWMARHEVRWSDWQAVMGQGEVVAERSRPVTGVSWEQARAFAARLNELSGKQQFFRLPSEAEWEYACRAGRKETGEPPLAEVFDMAWFSGTYRTLLEPAPVATLKPNAWGLYDLLGNAWEWVEDEYRAAAYARHGLFNPVSKGGGRQRVIRGGSYRSEANQMRCGNRAFYARDDTLPQIGFRLVLTRASGKGKGAK
jgi:formylglycine-generating enzyme required for sulfatase activity